MLDAGAFPHDSNDLPSAGPGRMCNTASTTVGRSRQTAPGRSTAAHARRRGAQPSGAVTRMSGASGEISPSAMTSTEANLSVLVMSTGVVSE